MRTRTGTGSLTIAAGLLGSLAALASAWGSDWPQWRGPARDAVSRETGLLQQWPTGGPPLGWKRKDPGGGHSGAAVAHRRNRSVRYRRAPAVRCGLGGGTGEPVGCPAAGAAA